MGKKEQVFYEDEDETEETQPDLQKNINNNKEDNNLSINNQSRSNINKEEVCLAEAAVFTNKLAEIRLKSVAISKRKQDEDAKAAAQIIYSERRTRSISKEPTQMTALQQSLLQQQQKALMKKLALVEKKKTMKAAKKLAQKKSVKKSNSNSGIGKKMEQKEEEEAEEVFNDESYEEQEKCEDTNMEDKQDSFQMKKKEEIGQICQRNLQTTDQQEIFRDEEDESQVIEEELEAQEDRIAEEKEQLDEDYQSNTKKKKSNNKKNEKLKKSKQAQTKKTSTSKQIKLAEMQKDINKEQNKMQTGSEVVEQNNLIQTEIFNYDKKKQNKKKDSPLLNKVELSKSNLNSNNIEINKSNISGQNNQEIKKKGILKNESLVVQNLKSCLKKEVNTNMVELSEKEENSISQTNLRRKNEKELSKLQTKNGQEISQDGKVEVKNKEESISDSYEGSESKEFESESNESSSSSEVVQAVKTMTFRSRRGEGMKKLMELQLRNDGRYDDEEDEFWKENKYFGCVSEVTKRKGDKDEDEEDEDFNAEEFKDVKDVFDSDFQDTSELESSCESDDVDVDSDSEKKRQQLKGKPDYMFKKDQIIKQKAEKERNKELKVQRLKQLDIEQEGEIQQQKKEDTETVAQCLLNQEMKRSLRATTNEKTLVTQTQSALKKVKVDSSQVNMSNTKNNCDDDNNVSQGQIIKKKRYIHDFFTQQQLLKEAVFTEFVNRKQLEDLLKLEEEKKQQPLGKKNLLDSKDIIVYKNSTKTEENTVSFQSTQVYDNTIGNYLKSSFGPYNPPVKKQFKYKDPKTGKSYNTLEEFYKYRTVLYKSEQNKQKYLVKVYKELQEKKQELLLELAPKNSENEDSNLDSDPNSNVGQPSNSGDSSNLPSNHKTSITSSSKKNVPSKTNQNVSQKQPPKKVNSKVLPTSFFKFIEDIEEHPCKKDDQIFMDQESD